MVLSRERKAVFARYLLARYVFSLPLWVAVVSIREKSEKLSR